MVAPIRYDQTMRKELLIAFIVLLAIAAIVYWSGQDDYDICRLEDARDRPCIY